MVALRTRLVEDVRTALAKDPAARNAVEVVLTYPGVHAVWFYRVANALWRGGFPLAARVLSHVARHLTGVEIHPAADVGRRLFIDHGMGVVVGETAEIGDDVLMYHGVTLGGTSMRREKRHPTVGDDVVVGANATLVGPITVGDGARVGAGAVVVDDVPPGATVTGPKAQVRSVASEGERSENGEDTASGSDDVESGREGVAAESGDGSERADDAEPSPDCLC